MFYNCKNNSQLSIKPSVCQALHLVSKDAFDALLII